MAQLLQITFDSADPQKLALFWAEVLGYQLQPPPHGFASWEEWHQKEGHAQNAYDFAAIVDPKGLDSRILFQRVPEPKTVKNRVHLDVNVSRRISEQPEEVKQNFVASEAERLKELGAREINRYNENGDYWITLADPEGNEFCIQ